MYDQFVVSFPPITMHAIGSKESMCDVRMSGGAFWAGAFPYLLGRIFALLYNLNAILLCLKIQKTAREEREAL